MKKPVKKATKTISGKKKKVSASVVSGRKNTTDSTRSGERQRSGNNDPQHGSH